MLIAIEPKVPTYRVLLGLEPTVIVPPPTPLTRSEAEFLILTDNSPEVLTVLELLLLNTLLPAKVKPPLAVTVPPMTTFVDDRFMLSDPAPILIAPDVVTV